MKQCIKCSVELVVGENWHLSAKKFKIYKCKSCAVKSRLEWRANNLEKERITDRRYKANNPDKMQSIRNKFKYKIPPAIYGAFHDCKLIYIGESGEPHQRISNHKTNMDTPVANALANGEIQRDKLRFKMLEFIDDTDTRKAREKCLIQRYKPVYNDLYV